MGQPQDASQLQLSPQVQVAPQQQESADAGAQEQEQVSGQFVQGQLQVSGMVFSLARKIQETSSRGAVDAWRYKEEAGFATQS